MTELKAFAQKEILSSAEFLEVQCIANELLGILNQENISKKINLANQPANKSQMVQKAFEEEAVKLGFTSEKKGLFSEYKTPALRPDYFKKTETSGILFEVERGKTTQNNMDILDLWKCHICKEASYLFLMVPKELRQNNKGGFQRTFNMVCNRIEPFYYEGNYTNVKATFVFGY